MGCADGIAHGINTVHLAYIRERFGHVIIAHRLWVPALIRRHTILLTAALAVCALVAAEHTHRTDSRARPARTPGQAPPRPTQG